MACGPLHFMSKWRGSYFFAWRIPGDDEMQILQVAKRTWNVCFTTAAKRTWNVHFIAYIQKGEGHEKKCI